LYSRANHVYIRYTNNGNGTHSATCTGCTNVKTEDHAYSNGTCTATGCGATESTGEGGESGDECAHTTYVQNNDSTHHWEECSECGVVKEETKEEHSGATHDNGGKCTTCGYKYENHAMNVFSGIEYEMTENTHTAIFKCTFTGCNEKHKGYAQNHMGASHTNEGKCTVCEYQYQLHIMSTEMSGWDKNELTHAPIYQCTYTGCTATETGTAEEHVNGNHDNEGKCTICEHQYQEHGQSEIISRYEKTSENHTPIYACKFTGCESTYSGQTEAHEGGDHSNEGKCTICEHQYQEHTLDTVPLKYEQTDTTHTPVYGCTYSGCTENEIGTEENHEITEWSDNENGTHSGICTICEYEALREHQFDENGECSDCGAIESTGEVECEHTYEIVARALVHYEKCTKCNQTKTGSLQLHQKTIEGENGTISCDFKDNEDGTHTWNCVICNYETSEKHSYEGGVCIACNAVEPQEECNHNYVIESNDTQHWEECTECGETKEDTTAEHIYEYTDNGNGTHNASCTVCDYTITQECIYEEGECIYCNAEDPNIETPPTECEHTYEMKNDTTTHWEECTKCGEKNTETTAAHTYEYTDNGNETHKATCTICNYETSRSHNYLNGECTDCNAKEPTSENPCAHEYVLNKNDQQHWEECTKCGNVNSETLSNHTYGNYTDNGNNTHSAVCVICDYVKTVSHEYQDGECKDCNAIDPNAECEHNYEMKSNTTSHWEECTKCNQVKTGTVETHTFTNYSDNGDGTHTGICSKCEYKLKSEHDYKNEICTHCNAKKEKVEEECEHTYVIKSDEDNHWAECSKCKEVKTGSLKIHNYDKYVDNKNGTHTKVCSECGYKSTEKHTTGDCKLCGSITLPEDEKKEPILKDPAIKDTTTTTDKEIPNAGTPLVIIIASVVLGSLTLLARFKMKKYKDI